MKIVTGKQMQALDRRTIDGGVSGDLLMERAGIGAFEALLEFIEPLPYAHRHRVVVINGKGNNGGDGYVVARLLAERTGYEAVVYSTCQPDELQGDAKLNADRLPLPINVCDRLPDDALRPGTVVLDCLLGTGISGPVREPYATIIGQIKESHLPVVAMDIPSGVDADTGAVAAIAVHADLTITMALPKIGLLRGDGARLCGRLRCVDIGIPATFVDDIDIDFAAEATLAADVRPLICRLPSATHKGDMGRILIVGGSADYPGAPMLAGAGALRAGGGLVTVACPRSIGPVLAPQDNALIRKLIDDDGRGTHGPLEAAEFADLTADKSVIAVGPGLGGGDAALGLVRDLLGTDKPVVLDADALQACSDCGDRLKTRAVTVLTPHPGEMARLIASCGFAGLDSADRESQASTVAKELNAIVVLKGHRTIVAAPDGRIFINTSGTPALATGGSGDVLCGVIAAVLCQCDNPVAAVRLAVFVHGLAAELSLNGMRGTTADDQPQLIAHAVQQLSPLA